jgi:hypothetical protein
MIAALRPNYRSSLPIPRIEASGELTNDNRILILDEIGDQLFQGTERCQKIVGAGIT